MAERKKKEEAAPDELQTRWPAEKIETRKVKILVPYANNARTHSDNQIDQIAESIKEWGWTVPVLIDEQDGIIAGHGRVLAANLLKIKEIPVMIATGWSETKKKAYIIADNKLALNAGWDENLLRLEMEMLKDAGFDLSLTGFNRDELDDMFPAVNLTDEDEVPDAPDFPTSELGDLWTLGNHKMLCGDSTSIEAVEKLMNGQRADMVFTDPPYNVDYKGAGKNTSRTIMNDKMTPEAFVEFLNGSFKSLKAAIKKGASCYIFHSHKTAMTFEAALKKNNFHIDTQLIWNKPSAGMGNNDYRTKHEPFFYCYQEKTEKKFYGDRTGTTVWRIPKDPTKALKWFMNQLVKDETGKSTVWSMKRSNVLEYAHPTQKPVELCLMALLNSSKSEDIILDLFLGSGTTLIAAEKANRACYGMELDPTYIDVIINRWQNYTGQQAIHENGQTFEEIENGRTQAEANCA